VFNGVIVSVFGEKRLR